ncbi:MAG: iron-sulfur cluster assembly scaffold protein [Thermoguttaceae bacterium]|jgi:NifU-like protein|nr:iron-sulfur cluster assembly scaffold protein [Thermoguttaceae bacterium]
MAWEYSEKTKQLFMDAVHGKPGTHLGEIENPDGFGEHGSIACGDSMRFTFRVRRHPTDPTKDVITEARYLTFGCTSAIASSEALCTLIEQGGYTPIQALSITNEDIVKFLDGLPQQKIHCSVMGAEALESAVFNWAQKRGVDLESLGVRIHADEEKEGRIVCKCFGLSEPYLRRKIEELNLRTIPEITGATKAGGACMACHHAPGGLQDLLNEVWGASGTRLRVVPKVERQPPPEPAPSPPALSPYQYAKRIEKTIDEIVRPMLAHDGGDVEIIDIKDNLVFCRLEGACAGCASAGQTLKLMVEKTLKDLVDERIRVVQV